MGPWMITNRTKVEKRVDAVERAATGRRPTTRPIRASRGAEPPLLLRRLSVGRPGGLMAAPIVPPSFFRNGLPNGVSKRLAALGVFAGFCRHAAFTAIAALMALILVVEDDEFIRQSVEWMIRDLGHDMLHANDLASALVHLSAPGHIDGLFVDIRLARLAQGGYDVANQAVGIRPGLRVLYTSGSPLTASMTALFVDGGLFIQKPYSADQFEFGVGELLH
jgi:CheY-like chemotaxis protein